MLIDFLIGLFAANALPHFVMGRLDARVLSLFGYGARANVLYSLFCVIVAVSLFQYKYGLALLPQHGMLCGVLLIVLCYYFGWSLMTRFLRDRTQP